MRRGHGRTLLRDLGRPLPRETGQLLGPARLRWGQLPPTDTLSRQKQLTPAILGQEASKAVDVTETESGKWTPGLGQGWELSLKGDSSGFARGQRSGEGCPQCACGSLLRCALTTGSDGKRVLFSTTIKQMLVLSFCPFGVEDGRSWRSPHVSATHPLTYLTATSLTSGGIVPCRSREPPPFQASAKQLCIFTPPCPPSPNRGWISWAPGWYQGPTASSWRGSRATIVPSTDPEAPPVPPRGGPRMWRKGSLFATMWRTQEPHCPRSPDPHTSP